MWSFLRILRQNSRKQNVIKRQKHDHWAKKKNEATEKALAHFDDFYQQVYTKNWPLIRAGLLGKQKYVAVVNNYSDDDRIMKNFELKGALNIRRLFEIESDNITDFKSKSKRKQRLNQIHKLDKQLDAKLVEKASHSLEKSIENAEIDQRRLIDSKNLLSGEILHEFVPATQIKGKEDFIPESTHYQFYQTENAANKFNVGREMSHDFAFPAHLNVYCFEEENLGDFPGAKSGSTGVLDYYLMDGGSVLPVLALGIQPGDRILDLCAAPGGKTLLALQTLYPEQIVANDVSISRTNRIYNVARQFLYDFDRKWLDSGRLKIISHDGRYLKKEQFDRVLVDVPCTTDRNSLRDNENNIFRASRIKERLKLPELQAELLVNALKLVKKDGVVVYSTCSLSPIQNDGVVHMALKQIWEETKLDFVVQDLGAVLQQTKNVYKLADRKLMKYGQLVVPNIAQNFGPTYFCKIKRIN